MPVWLDITIGTIAVLSAAAAVVAFAVRFILLPWLRDNLVDPVKRTHHTVTTNHHTSEEPTLLDRISELKSSLEAVSSDLGDVRDDQAGLIRAVATATTIATDARDTLERHVRSGERYLGQVQVVLKDHGIELPRGDGED